ncbi:MAG: mechanosensitive ion channel, partial [Magnetococcales bacterium]|nr:mechanosensitive ion channel [Magnetococcales bacterium]
NPDVVGVVGHWSGTAAAQAVSYYGDHKLPALLMTNGEDGALKDNPWVFRPLIDETMETSFLANYVRNVVGEKMVFVIHEANARGEHLAATFDAVYQRFGTKILYKWAINPDVTQMDQELKAVVAEVEAKKLFGTYLILGEASSGAKMISSLREGGVRQPIVGLRHLATKGFRDAFVASWKGKGSPSAALNGMLMTTPMLFDTAGEQAQKFQTGYANLYNFKPDWVASYAYESAKLMTTALSEVIEKDKDTPLRLRLRDRIAAYNTVESAFVGLNGPLFFNAKGSASRATKVGLSDGTNLVAAMTQLSPIREEGVTNLLGEVTSGRALYVNDRFMYKTNVVYTGVRFEKVVSLDRATNTTEINFNIWFRWRGDFDPQDVTFTNAVTPIKLESPVREGKDGDMNYRAYRLSGKFYMGYSNVERNYGTQLVGMSFHHRTLGSNNLMYVNDILGMNLMDAQESKATLPTPSAEKESSNWLSAFNFDSKVTDPMVASLIRDKVLAGVSGWVVLRGWISQEIMPRGVDGNPVFVGFGKPQPLFSMLDAGMVLKPDRLDARDFILTKDNFIYVAIFSLVMSVLARLLDNKDRGQFWRIQSLFLRLIFWPLLLVTLGNLIRDYSLHHYSTATVDILVTSFDILWFLIPARLTVISMERFIWIPLETRTQRKIPNVLRMTLNLIIYLLAIFGVIAFVMDKSITSMLATSGVMAMIIGMAVQSNLRDIVSGIMLNIERPFNIGDTIKLNNNMGVVTDITWRTTRLTSLDGQLLSFPNSKTSDSEIQNFSKPQCIKRNLNLYTDPRHDPKVVLALIKECLSKVKTIQGLPPQFASKAYYFGTMLLDDHWVSHYPIGIFVPFAKRKAAIQEFWELIWQSFQEHNILWRDFADDDASFEPIGQSVKKSFQA